MKRKFVCAALGALLSLCSATQAAVLCGDPTSVLSTTDVQFGGTQAAACFGLVAGAPEASALGFDTRAGYGDFSLLAGGIAPGSVGIGQALDINFTIGVTQLAGDVGGWSLSWSGTGLPATLDIVAVIQNSVGTWGSYLFTDLVFANQGSGTGTWGINFIDRGLEGPPSLVALSLFARGPDVVPTPTPTPPPVPASEPGSLSLAALALALAASFSRWRRSRGRQSCPKVSRSLT